MTSQEYNNGRQILPQPQRTTAGADPKASGPRIINRDYRGMPSTSQRPNSHSRSESHSSASSMDVDEMILKATTGDEGAAAMAATASNGMPNGRHYPDSPQHQPAHLTIQQQQQQHLQQTQMSSRSSRRLIDRDTEDMHPTAGGSPYPQQQASSSSSGYPANQNPVGQVRSNIGGSGGGGGQGSQSHVYTTHVFAPPMTGAPTKKSKFPNSAVPPLPLTTTTGSSPVPGEFFFFDFRYPFFFLAFFAFSFFSLIFLYANSTTPVNPWGRWYSHFPFLLPLVFWIELLFFRSFYFFSRAPFASPRQGWVAVDGCVGSRPAPTRASRATKRL